MPGEGLSDGPKEREAKLTLQKAESSPQHPPVASTAPSSRGRGGNASRHISPCHQEFVAAAAPRATKLPFNVPRRLPKQRGRNTVSGYN